MVNRLLQEIEAPYKDIMPCVLMGAHSTWRPDMQGVMKVETEVGLHSQVEE